MKRFVLAALGAALIAGGVVASACEDQTEGIRRQNDAVRTPATNGSGSSGKTDVFDLRVGDCVGAPPGDEEYATMNVVACDGGDALARVSELITVEQTTGDYPGEDYMDAQATERCSDPDGPALWPTEGSWDAGDRTIICFVFLVDPDDGSDLFDLQVGDCISEPNLDDEDLVGGAQIVDCDSEDAVARVSKLVRVEDSGSGFPGEGHMEDQAAEECPNPTAPVFYPTEESWLAGDRTITCLETLE